jgi:hypothetical protein
MAIQFNIKNDEAYALARDISQRTGSTMTQAVLDSLRARQRELTKAERLERAMEIARDMRARLGPDFFAIEHGDLLYDEFGLPK